MPNKPYYRDGDHQLMPTLYVGHAQSKGSDDPEDLFVVDGRGQRRRRRLPLRKPAAR